MDQLRGGTLTPNSNGNGNTYAGSRLSGPPTTLTNTFPLGPNINSMESWSASRVRDYINHFSPFMRDDIQTHFETWPTWELWNDLWLFEEMKKYDSDNSG